METARALAAIILDVVYGKQISSVDDHYIKLAVDSMISFSDSRVPGRYWLDFMPLLKYIPAWVPGAAAAKYGARVYPQTQEMLNKPFDTIKQQVQEMVSRLRILIAI